MENVKTTSTETQPKVKISMPVYKYYKTTPETIIIQNRRVHKSIKTGLKDAGVSGYNLGRASGIAKGRQPSRAIGSPVFWWHFGGQSCFAALADAVTG
jgi:hypothetical protein